MRLPPDRCVSLRRIDKGDGPDQSGTPVGIEYLGEAPRKESHKVVVEQETAKAPPAKMS